MLTNKEEFIELLRSTNRDGLEYCIFDLHELGFFLCCIPSKWTIIFDDLSHFAIFLSLLEHETPCKCPFGHLLSHIKQQTIGSNFY